MNNVAESKRSEIVKEWTHHGIDCKIVKIDLGHYCGYVKAPNPDELDMAHGYPDLDAHGGITYGPDNDGWVGFDTAHAWDVCVDENGELFGTMEPMYDKGCEASIVWTPESVEEEVEQVAEQLSE